MILAATKGPGAFSEWNYQKNLRMAIRHSAPDEIMPDESYSSFYASVYESVNEGGSHAVERNYAPPRMSKKHSFLKAANRLKKRGFKSARFIEMETLFQVDRSYYGTLVGIDRMIARGNRLAALEELDQLILSMNPANKRGLVNLYLTKTRLVSEMEAPPELIFEITLKRFQTLAEIARIEIEGYQGIPKFRNELLRSQRNLENLEKEMSRLRANRSLAFRVIRSGITAGKVPESFAQLMRDHAKKQKEKHPDLSDEEVDNYLQMVETLPKAAPEEEYGKNWIDP